MKVYKFGGASIADAQGFKRVTEILRKENEPICVIISALGKTTNALEKVSHSFYHKLADLPTHFENIKKVHYSLMEELFEVHHPIFGEIENSFLEIDWVIDEEPHTSYDFIYDQIVSIGEIASSKILSHYLKDHGIENDWMDSRGFIKTDNNYRNAWVDWELTQRMIQKKLRPVLEKRTVICAGFIGGTSENYTTTLGREGSDYSGAIFASCLQATSLTVWKDVPGFMNADPKINSKAVFIPELSYHELAELSYYGASVIHPKTIKPLLELGIPLFIKSFLQPDEVGTLVNKKSLPLTIPNYILKTNQMLISIYSLDGGFMVEEHLTKIYFLLNQKGISINLAVNSALSFSVLLDEVRYQEIIPDLLQSLSSLWNVRYNTGLNLLTVRHDGNSPLDLEPYTHEQEIIIEIKTRHTLQKVYRKT